MTNIPIFLASDDNYAPFLCTTLFSILENTNASCEFYVLDNKITEISKMRIKKSLCKFNNYFIEYIDISNIGLDKFPNLRHYSVNTFSRYFIPDLKPNLSKVLYLDVDIIVKGDIKELFDEDLKGKALGVTSENFYELNGIYVKENLNPNFKDTKNYFNAGILVMDLAKIKEQNLMKICIEKTIELADKLSCPDQDVLNIVFESNVEFISQKFDYMPDHHFFYEKFLGLKNAEQLKKEAVILHYTAGKPWFYDSCASSDFWKICSKTLFYGKIIKRIEKYYARNIKYLKNESFDLNFLEKIFSVKNQFTLTHKQKVVTILGLRIKLKKTLLR